MEKDDCGESSLMWLHGDDTVLVFPQRQHKAVAFYKVLEVVKTIVWSAVQLGQWIVDNDSIEDVVYCSILNGFPALVEDVVI